MMQGSGGLF